MEIDIGKSGKFIYLNNLINRKVFYIMKVIYIHRINRLMALSVRSVQQSLNIGKPKYILKILINR
jgi:hypothetical protein